MKYYATYANMTLCFFSNVYLTLYAKAVSFLLSTWVSSPQGHYQPIEDVCLRTSQCKNALKWIWCG